MNANTLRTPGKAFPLFGFFLALAGCSSSSDNGPDCRYNEAWINGECSIPVIDLEVPSGIWTGTDTAGREVLLLVSGDGNFRYVDGAHNQASGYLPPQGEVSGAFDLVTPLDQPFADGSTIANCSFTSSLVERVSIDFTPSCRTTGGLQFSDTLALDFDPLYDRNSSLATVAGTYRTTAGNVLSVAGDGLLFSQDATTGCVVNGHIGLISPSFNIYFVTLGYDSCTGPEAALNGSLFDGFAVLDDTGAPESLVMALIGNVGAAAASSFERAERL
jgi:hypothetical protein